MKTALIISAIAACYAFFATSKMLPSWVHQLCASGYDKHAHFVIFCVLQVICTLNFRDYTPLSIAAVLAITGILIEFLQQFTERSFCVQDIFANMAGLLFAIFLTQLFNKFNFSL